MDVLEEDGNDVDREEDNNYDDDDEEEGEEMSDENTEEEQQPESKKIRFASPPPSASLDNEFILLVDILTPSIHSKSLLKKVPSHSEAFDLIRQCVETFQHEKEKPQFSTYFAALQTLLSCIKLDPTLTLNRTLKRACYTAAMLTKSSNENALTLSAFLRDKCKQYLEDWKFIYCSLLFRIGSLGVMKYLKITLDTLPKSPHTKSGRIQVHFFKGRECLLANRPREALERFTLAFKEFPTSSSTGKTLRNQQRVFSRLLPLKIVFEGKTPTPQLLERMNMTNAWNTFYLPLLHAAQQGNEAQLLTLFPSTYFDRLDVSLVLKTYLQAVCRQHVLKHVCKLLNGSDQLDLGQLASLTCFQRDNEFVLFVLTDLCSRGLLNGYATLQSLKLHKTQPFKKLSEAVNKTYRDQLEFVI